MIQRSGLCTAFFLLLPAFSDAHEDPESFDFTHVELAIRYFEDPSEILLARIAESAAATHLKRHSDRTGYYPAEASSWEITKRLLAKSPSADALTAVGALVRYAAHNSFMQKKCMAIAASYLPDVAQPKNPLHVTWGYDIGVSMDDHSSLNFAHPHFLSDPGEVWYYCIHEVHHSGVMQLHPMPDIAAIDTIRELYEFTRYATFLEGLAVHAAYETRRVMGDLGKDEDYVALTDARRLDRILARYEKGIAYLKSEFGRALDPKHWLVIEEMSSGERLWYVAGASMAAAIEKAQGRPGLLKVTSQGPEAFFEAYGNVSTKLE